MKTFVTAVVVATLIFTPPLFAAPPPSVPSLQRDVDKAQANLDAAKEKAEAGLSSPNKVEWEQAEAKFESMVTSGKDAKQIAAQKDALKELDVRTLPSAADRDNMENARSKFAVAQARLDVAKSRLRNGPDDSSQANQPEIRTENGSGFTIRSEREAENHPPLPSSQ